jgi:DHA3 family macrolide efflux protein-like MFS transporter
MTAVAAGGALEQEPTEAALPSAPQTLFNRDFVLLAQGQLVSQVGNQAFLVGIMFWTMGATGSATLMGLLMTVSQLPGILLGPLGGTLADRHSRRTIIVLSDFLRGIAMLALVWLFRLTEAPDVIVPALFAVALFGGIMNAFFQPAISAAIPDLVPDERVASANSFVHFSAEGSALLGQALGGVLYRTLGAPLLFLANGVSFIISALSEAFIRIPQPMPAARRPGDAGAGGYLHETAAGLRFVWRWRGLRTLLGVAAGLNFFISPVIVLLPFYVEGALGRGAEWYGFLLAAISAGYILGLVVAGTPWSRSSWYGRLVLGCLLTDAGMIALLGLVRSPGWALAICFIMGLFAAVFNIFVVTLLQLRAPTGMRGRVMAVLVTVTGAAMPLGMTVSGILGDLTGKNTALVFGISGMCAMAYIGFAILSPSLRAFIDSNPGTAHPPLPDLAP